MSSVKLNKFYKMIKRSCKSRGRLRRRRTIRPANFSRFIWKGRLGKLSRISILFCFFTVISLVLGCSQPNQSSHVNIWTVSLVLLFDLAKDMMKELAKKILERFL